MNRIPAIGRIEGLNAADDKGLHGLVIFNDKDYDPFGWAIGQRVKAGVIRAGSVGFRVIEIEIPDKETVKDGTTLIFRKQELLEFSICNVPANPWVPQTGRVSGTRLSGNMAVLKTKAGGGGKQPGKHRFWVIFIPHAVLSYLVLKETQNF